MAPPNQRGLASADELRLNPLPFKPSDLVVDLPKPLVRTPTHHYTDARFFRQVHHIHGLVGDIIHISGSPNPETEGALQFSNVYALYEVSHWPGAEQQLTWTIWTLRTIAAALHNQPIPACPPAARTLLTRCIREGLLHRYSWLFQLFPDLQVAIESVPFARRLGRNPNTSVVDGELGGPLQIRRIMHATGIPECRADTAAITTPADPALKGKIFTGCDERPVYMWICPEDSLVSIKSQAVRTIREATAVKRKLPWGLGDVKLALHDIPATGKATASNGKQKKKQPPRHGFATQTDADRTSSNSTSNGAISASQEQHNDNDGQTQNQTTTLQPLWQIPNRPQTQAAATTGPVPIDTNAIDTDDLQELDGLLARTFGHTAWTATSSSIAQTRPSPSRSPPKTPTPAPLNVPGTDSTIALLSSAKSSESESAKTVRPPATPSPVVLPPSLRPGRAEHAVEAMRAARRERLGQGRDFMGRGFDVREETHAQTRGQVQGRGLSQIQIQGQGLGRIQIPSQSEIAGRGPAPEQSRAQERSPSMIPRDQAPPVTFGEVAAANAAAAAADDGEGGDGPARKKRKTAKQGRAQTQRYGHASGMAMGRAGTAAGGAGGTTDAAAAINAAASVAAGMGVGVMSEQEVRRAVGAARIGVDAGVLDPALFRD